MYKTVQYVLLEGGSAEPRGREAGQPETAAVSCSPRVTEPLLLQKNYS